MVLIRDPANLGLMYSALARDNAVRAGFTNAPAMPLSEFIADFFTPGTQHGVALMTDHP